MAVPQTGLIGSEQALQGGLQDALAALQGSTERARVDLGQFADSGARANLLQSQLSGARGPQAQAQAFADFQASPGQQFLRDQQEQALLRSAGATGGLGGANVLSALQEQATGFAAQDFGNQFARLGDVAGRGLQAAGQRSNLEAQRGQGAANLQFGAGQQLASGRTRAGEQIASNLSGTTSALAQLLSGAGTASAASGSNLAQILANIAGGQGSQISGLGGVPGVQQGQGNIGGLGQLAGGLGTLASFFSDIRLKDNIRKIGETPGGHNLYTWDWNKQAEPLVGEQPSFGVIAQEAEKINPDMVELDDSGFLKVNYKMVT